MLKPGLKRSAIPDQPDSSNYWKALFCIAEVFHLERERASHKRLCTFLAFQHARRISYEPSVSAVPQ